MQKEKIIIGLVGESGSGKDTAAKYLKEKYGFDAEFIVGTGGELANKLISGRSAGLYEADLYLAGTSTPITALQPKGIFDPIKPMFVLPEVLDAKVWPGGEMFYIDRERMYGIPIALYPSITIVKNTELVKREEASAYADLLNPKWEGK